MAKGSDYFRNGAEDNRTAQIERSLQTLGLSDVSPNHSSSYQSFSNPHTRRNSTSIHEDNISSLTGYKQHVRSNTMQNYFTPQMQIYHRFRSESVETTKPDAYWNDPMFSNSSQQPDMMDPARMFHQRTFSSPAFSLMFESMDLKAADLGH